MSTDTASLNSTKEHTAAPSATHSPEPSSNALRKNRLVLLLFIALFMAPVIAAYTVLKTDHWKSRDATHHGELLQPPLHTEQLNTYTLKEHTPQKLPTGQWLLLYASPATCNLSCQNSLYIMKQVHIGLGPTQHRVNKHLLLPNSDGALDTDPEHLKGIEHQWRWSIDSSQPSIIPGNLYVTDPLGNIILKYTLSEDHQEAIMQAKGLLRDLKKLLKLSRIG